jgi:predicted nuclease of predicted toxin-antitoxin system
MAIGYYMDVQVPLAITDQLRLREVDVLTAQEDGTREFADSDLLNRASELGRVFVTQDADLLVEGDLRQRTGRSFVSVIYAPQTRATIGQCVENLELIAKASESSEWVNRVEFVPLK